MTSYKKEPPQKKILVPRECTYPQTYTVLFKKGFIFIGLENRRTISQAVCETLADKKTHLTTL